MPAGTFPSRPCSDRERESATPPSAASVRNIKPPYTPLGNWNIGPPAKTSEIAETSGAAMQSNAKIPESHQPHPSGASPGGVRGTWRTAIRILTRETSLAIIASKRSAITARAAAINPR